MQTVSAREALLDGARQCLEDRGYARTTARDVAAAAGVSLGTIPYHFGSMEVLLSEAIADNARDWLASFASLVAEGASASPGGLLRRSVVEFFRLLESDRAVLICFLEAVALADRLPGVRRRLAAQYEELRHAVDAMLARVLGSELASSGVDLHVLSSLLLAVSDGIIVQFLLDPAGAPSADDVCAALDALGVLR